MSERSLSGPFEGPRRAPERYFPGPVLGPRGTPVRYLPGPPLGPRGAPVVRLILTPCRRGGRWFDTTSCIHIACITCTYKRQVSELWMSEAAGRGQMQRSGSGAMFPLACHPSGMLDAARLLSRCHRCAFPPNVLPGVPLPYPDSFWGWQKFFGTAEGAGDVFSCGCHIFGVNGCQ